MLHLLASLCHAARHLPRDFAAETANGSPSTANSPTVEYTRGPDMGGGVGGLLYSSRSDGILPSPTLKYALSNGRGDIVAQADQNAVLTWTASYEAYGKRTRETGSNADKQRANSKDEDPTGLLNEGFRYRDLETGVWLSRDPAGFVDGPNLYAYVKQNPWTAWDPHGLASVARMWDHLIHGEFKKAVKEAPLLGPSTSFNDIKGLANLPKAITETAKKTATIADKLGAGVATGHVVGELTGANRFAEGVLSTEVNLDSKGHLVENKLTPRESIVRTIEGIENILTTALTLSRVGAPKAANSGVRANTLVHNGLEVRAVRSLSHVDDSTLAAMAQRGFAPRTINGDKIVLHHHQQNPAGFIVEMPARNHNIWNPRQHPFGNTPGAGLSAEQRAAFDAWRVDYWKTRAATEIQRRAGP